MKRLCFILMVALALLIAFPGISVAQDEITVISSDADPSFPYRITFSLEAESSTEITDIDLAYRVEKLSLVPISCRVDADFTPGLRVNASWTWNMLETGGLPPGVEVVYWWLIEDATGQKIETSPATFRFDDLSYDWSSLTSDQVTLYWYEGDHFFAEALIDAADEALERLASDTGVSLEQPARIYIYASFEELRGALVYPYEWTGG
ncbi:MAG: peptidase MA family metallohydrolase, partial [Dehalococcoidia bacterium]